jgi:5-hydroxyisourate hydrolase-like protein (transthyretin family)
MKAIIYLLSFVLLTAMTFKSNVLQGDPMADCDVKVGHIPPNGGQIIATGVTNNDGTVEFKDLAPLAAGERYYVEFGIKEKGIKAAAIAYKSADFSNFDANENAQPIVVTEKKGDYETRIEVRKVKVNEADLAKQRGPISTSRSNIKITIVKIKK